MPTVSFNVRKAKILAPFRYQVITFEHVIQINGRAYDDATGVFTAPYNGTYLFAVQVCSYEGEYDNVILVVDDKKNEILVVGDFQQNTSYMSTSGTVIHWLAKGQEVWVMSYYSSTQLYESN